MATLWVAAGSHCRLEVLSGFEFLSCCHHAEADQSPAHHEKECGSDGCAAIELGFYRLETLQQAPLRPLLALVAWVVPLPDYCRPTAPTSPVIASSAPPEISRLWQFFQRTALPPRAPSSGS